MNRFCLMSAVFAIGSGAASATSDTATSFHANLPGGAHIALEIPSTWQATAEAGGPFVTVRISPADQGDFVLLLTAIPVLPESPVATREGVRDAVLELGHSKLHTAVQDDIELIEISSADAVGYFYHLTDRAPGEGPGHYPEAHQGILLLGEYGISFTLLTHTEDFETLELALGVLKTLQLEGHSGDTPRSSANVSFSREGLEVYQFTVPRRG